MEALQNKYGSAYLPVHLKVDHSNRNGSLSSINKTTDYPQHSISPIELFHRNGNHNNKSHACPLKLRKVNIQSQPQCSWLVEMPCPHLLHRRNGP